MSYLLPGNNFNQCCLVHHPDEICRTIIGGGGRGGYHAGNEPKVIVNEVYRIMEKEYEYRIRKLTPKECWRLMGWDDESFHKAEAVNSNTQLYKQAGNGIVVPVLEAIFAQML